MAEQRRTQAQRREAARDQILRAALRVFSLKGYGPASMEDIRLAAGCSKGGLYHHFASKKAVLAAIAAALGFRGMPPKPDEALGRALGLSELAAGRIVLDIWAEAARDAALSGIASGEEQESGGALERTIAAGVLVALLTRGAGADEARAAERLGVVDRAA